MFCLRRIVLGQLAFGFATMLALDPALLCAQSVRGHGGLSGGFESSFGIVLPSQISVDAWLDDDGEAHGSVTWIGDSPFFPGEPDVGTGGPAYPYKLDVVDMVIWGNFAIVWSVVAESPDKSAVGEPVVFFFLDNSDFDEPDEIGSSYFGGTPLDAGNITVSP